MPVEAPDVSSKAGDRITMVRNVAILAVALVEDDRTEHEFRTTIEETVDRLGDTVDASLLREAASEIGKLIEPLEVPVEQLEMTEHVHAMLGVMGATEQLGAQIRARELLDRWAGEL
jgi:hypothetical protein